MHTMLEDLVQAIWMLYGGKMPNDLAELLKLASVGPKIAFLTLEFGYNKIAVNSIELSGILYDITILTILCLFWIGYSGRQPCEDLGLHTRMGSGRTVICVRHRCYSASYNLSPVCTQPTLGKNYQYYGYGHPL